MISYLEDLCYREKIKIEYMNDKVLGKPEGQGIIKVHEVFKNCPYEVAEAIVQYYLNCNKNAAGIRVILDYLKEICSNSNTSFKNDKVYAENEEKGDLTKDEDKEDNYEEVNITNIEVKSLYKDDRFSYDNQVIKLQGNNVLELKIVVEPPLT